MESYLGEWSNNYWFANINYFRTKLPGYTEDDPKCLKFYNNKRNVKTASKMEVNKPIYKTSISKWKKFSEHLNPLYNIIKPYVK